MAGRLTPAPACGSHACRSPFRRRRERAETVDGLIARACRSEGDAVGDLPHQAAAACCNDAAAEDQGDVFVVIYGHRLKGGTREQRDFLGLAIDHGGSD